MDKLLTQIVAIAVKAGQAIMDVYADPANAVTTNAVVNEAGGIVCDLDGDELRYNKADLHNPGFLVMPVQDKAQRLSQVTIQQVMPHEFASLSQ